MLLLPQKILDLAFLFAGSMFAHFVAGWSVGRPPTFPELLEAGVTAVIIVGVCMLCSEIFFKNSFIGVLFGILVAALTHPLYDILYWKATGHPLGKAGTDLFDILVERMGTGPMALVFIASAVAMTIRKLF